MRPELPYLAAGTITFAGEWSNAGAFPKATAYKIFIGTMILILVTSMTGGTKIAPLVRAIGLLLLLSAIIRAVPRFRSATPQTKGKAKKNG